MVADAPTVLTELWSGAHPPHVVKRPLLQTKELSRLRNGEEWAFSFVVHGKLLLFCCFRSVPRISDASEYLETRRLRHTFPSSSYKPRKEGGQ